MALTATYTLSNPLTEDDLVILDTMSEILTDGIESGYINYWASHRDYLWVDDEKSVVDIADGLGENRLSLRLPEGRSFDSRALIREHHEQDDPAQMGGAHSMGDEVEVTAERMLDAAVKIIQGRTGLASNHRLIGNLLSLLREPQDRDYDFDAEDADILIQVAVCGDILYG